MAWKCVSERWDNDGGTYATVVEFLEMCAAAFGEMPALLADPGAAVPDLLGEWVATNPAAQSPAVPVHWEQVLLHVPDEGEG